MLMLLLAVVRTATADKPQALQEPDLVATSLAELGFVSGYTFEGLQSNHEKVFHFPVPRSTVSGPGELIIDYASSPQLDARSMLRVDVNGAPKIARHLGREASRGRLSIPLDQAELQRFEYLNVAVKASLLVNGDRCLNDRLQINYLHLQPDSGLRLQLKSQAGSLREAWDLLPKRVGISLPTQLTEQAFANALLLARHLQRDGKRVEFVHLPSFADLVVSDRQSLEQAIEQRYLTDEEMRLAYGIESIPLPPAKDAYLLRLPDRQVAVFSEPFANLPADLFSTTWRKVALGSAYDARVEDTQADRVDGQDGFRVPLERLGLDLSTRYVSRSTSWFLPLTPSKLAGDLRPDVLHLEMISSPSDTPIPLMLQVFLNGTLQSVKTLPNDGQFHRYTVYLSPHDYTPGHNDLRITVQRNLMSGDCMTEPPAYPVQLTANSYLVVSQQREKPQEFHDLHAWFANGFDLLVPKPDLVTGLANLRFLSNLFSHNDYPLLAERIRFFTPGQTISTPDPFILLGEGDLEVREAGVSFQRGRIQVLNRQGRMLLDVDRLPHLTISQLVQAGQSHGLWILPRDAEPSPMEKPLVLQNNSVAFSDPRGLLLALNPAYREISQIDYPEYQAWFDYLGRYRFWLLALGWLLLTLLVAHLYGKAREHRRLEKGA